MDKWGRVEVKKLPKIPTKYKRAFNPPRLVRYEMSKRVEYSPAKKY